MVHLAMFKDEKNVFLEEKLLGDHFLLEGRFILLNKDKPTSTKLFQHRISTHLIIYCVCSNEFVSSHKIKKI